MDKKKTQTGAENLKRDEGCCFEDIKLKEAIDNKEKTTLLYKKDSKVNRDEYIVITGEHEKSGDKKKIILLSDRDKVQCPITEFHNKISIDKNEIIYSNNSEVEVEYQYEKGLLPNTISLKRYIWPSEFDFKQCNVRLKSCENAKMVKLKLYPDVQWAIAISFGLSNPLSIRWKEWDRGDAVYRPPDTQETARKLGQDALLGKETKLAFEFKGKWNEGSVEQSFKYEFEQKIKFLSQFFESLNGSSILDFFKKQTGGIPLSFKTLSPNVSISGQWQLCKNSDSTQIGKKAELEFEASPLFGISATLDLLGVGIMILNPGAYQIYERIKKALNSTKYVKADFYINLIVSGEIQISIKAVFCTIKEENINDSPLQKIVAKGGAVISLELSAGAYIKAKFVVVFIEVEGEFEASFSGKASIKLELGYEINNDGLILNPKVLFEGLYCTVVFANSVDMKVKKGKKSSKHSLGAKSKKKEEKNRIEVLKPCILCDPKITLIGNK